MKILFLVPYPLEVAASQRFRFEQYFNLLEKEGFQITIRSFMSLRTWLHIYKKGYFIHKVLGISKGYIIRIITLFQVYQYDLVFIHREAAPIGPPFFEWVIAKIFRKKIVYDFDDAIWLPNYSESNKLFSFLKRYSDVSKICSWAYKVSCGNDYLCNYAKQFNTNVFYNPTTIDTVHYHNKTKDQNERVNGKIVFGWTGTHSTIRYLNDLIPILKELEDEIDFELHVISDVNPKFSLKSFVYKEWNIKTEISDLLLFNIGLMPLTDDKWANGKCGFKVLQYFALGIPALVSPVGVNSKIVSHAYNGFLCNSENDWKEHFKSLVNNQDLLTKLGANAKSKIEESFSVQSNSNNFLSLFNDKENRIN